MKVLSSICFGLCLLTGVALIVQGNGLYAIWPMVLSVFFAGSVMSPEKTGKEKRSADEQADR